MRGKRFNRGPKDPDPHYKSRVITKMINMVMESGKKSIAQRIVYGALEKLSEDDSKDPRTYFEDAVRNIMPDVEVRSRRVGGANYQIPMPVKFDRAETMALRWIIGSARNQKGTPMENALRNEIKAAYNREGSAYKKKEDTHRMAEANRAFAHFRW